MNKWIENNGGWQRGDTEYPRVASYSGKGYYVETGPGRCDTLLVQSGSRIAVFNTPETAMRGADIACPPLFDNRIEES